MEFVSNLYLGVTTVAGIQQNRVAEMKPLKSKVHGFFLNVTFYHFPCPEATPNHKTQIEKELDGTGDSFTVDLPCWSPMLKLWPKPQISIKKYMCICGIGFWFWSWLQHFSMLFSPGVKQILLFGHIPSQEPAKPIGFLCIVFPANDNGNQQKPSWDDLFIPMTFF